MEPLCRPCRDARELLERERARASLAETRGAARDRLLTVAATESTAMANSLLGWTQALRRDFGNRVTRDSALSHMEARIVAHLEVLERLLEVSTGESGGELSLVRLDLSAVVLSALDAQRSFAGERSVSLPSMHRGATGVVVLADRARVARSVGDLLAECIRVAEIGSRIDVEITADATLHLTVPKRRSAIDPGRVGILAARHVAFVHGGSFDTHIDGLSLGLPVFEPTETAARLSPTKTLLVVRHEEPDIAELLAALATARGMRVLTVPDEDLAVRACELHDPDVVVLGGPDGFDRLRAVLARASERIKTVSSAQEASDLVRSLVLAS